MGESYAFSFPNLRIVSMDNLQRINVKIYTPSPPGTKLEPFLDILNRWKEADTEWLDIADYLHLEDGPGVVLFGKQRFISFDRNLGQTGVLYAHRYGLEGDLKTRLQTVLSNALSAAKKMVSDSKCPEEISVRVDHLEFSINDRLQAPNTAKTHQKLGTLIRDVGEEQLGANNFEIQRIENARELFGYHFYLKTPLHLK